MVVADGPCRAKEIEAKAGGPNDDSLRCRPFCRRGSVAAVPAIRPRSAGLRVGDRRDLYVRRCVRRSPVDGVSGVIAAGRTRTYTKKVRSRVLEGGDRTVGVGEGGLEMGEDLAPPVRADWQAAAAARAAGTAPSSAVRIVLWPRSKRFQMRCKVRSLRWQWTARMAAGMLPATASWRNRHRPRGGQAQSSDLVGEPDAEGPSATGSCVAVAAKDPPGAEGFALGAACRQSRTDSHAESGAPTALQWGQGVCLSLSAIAFHSSSLRQNHRCSPTGTDALRKSHDFTGVEKVRGSGGVRYKIS